MPGIATSTAVTTAPSSAPVTEPAAQTLNNSQFGTSELKNIRDQYAAAPDTTSLDNLLDSPSAQLFKDNNSSQGLGQPLTIRQASDNDCHLLATIYGMSLTPAGSEALERLVTVTQSGKQGTIQVTFPGGQSASVTQSDLNTSGLSNASQGVRAIEVADAKVRQQEDPHPASSWTAYIESGNFASVTLQRLTNNSPAGAELQLIPADARENYLKDMSTAMQKNRDGLVVVGSMINDSSALEKQGIKISTVEVEEKGKTRRYNITLPDGTKGTLTETDLKDNGITGQPPSGPKMIELAEKEKTAGRFSLSHSNPGEWATIDEVQFLPSGMPFVPGHVFTIVGSDPQTGAWKVANPWDTTKVKEMSAKEFGAVFNNIDWSSVKPGTTSAGLLPDAYRWMAANGIKPSFYDTPP